MPAPDRLLLPAWLSWLAHKSGFDTTGRKTNPNSSLTGSGSGHHMYQHVQWKPWFQFQPTSSIFPAPMVLFKPPMVIFTFKPLSRHRLQKRTGEDVRTDRSTGEPEVGSFNHLVDWVGSPRLRLGVNESFRGPNGVEKPEASDPKRGRPHHPENIGPVSHGCLMIENQKNNTQAKRNSNRLRHEPVIVCYST